MLGADGNIGTENQTEKSSERLNEPIISSPTRDTIAGGVTTGLWWFVVAMVRVIVLVLVGR